MRKVSPETDQLARSLLQKAVRRSDRRLVERAFNYLCWKNDFRWLRGRLAVMVFEECWPYTASVSFPNDKEVIKQHYVNLQGLVKNKSAAGLGSLAYAHFRGDSSVLTFGKSSDIRLISKAIKEPKAFWDWVIKESITPEQKHFCTTAYQGFKKSGWPWDRAFAQATAFLSQCEDSEASPVTSPIQETTPIWVGIDKHTPIGKQIISDAARSIGVKANIALWISFYYESAKCFEFAPSYWWDSERLWRLSKLGVSDEEASAIWRSLVPKLVANLQPFASELERRLDSTPDQCDIDDVAQSKLF